MKNTSHESPETTLLILAAGLGSRYGGLKQVDPVGPNNATILDYSLYDAWRAGFTNATLVIQPHMEEQMCERLAPRLDGRMTLKFAYQTLDDVPENFTVPETREKPWGTGHAVLAARNTVKTPFAVINADDFYGRKSFELLNNFLRASQNTAIPTYVIAAYRLASTLSPHGSVSRGVCTESDGGFLLHVDEKTDIHLGPDGVPVCDNGDGTTSKLAPETPVSLNTWGFTPTFFQQLEALFAEFLENYGHETKTEFYLPAAVAELIRAEKARVKVEHTPETWFGVTYREDKTKVQQQIADLIDSGIYPKNLWANP
jgi:UTP-glucose-1-phosphate uridylyltransferase